MMPYKLVTIFKSIWYHVPGDINPYIITEDHLDHHKVTDEMTMKPQTVHIFHCPITHTTKAHNLYFVFDTFWLMMVQPCQNMQEKH